MYYTDILCLLINVISKDMLVIDGGLTQLVVLTIIGIIGLSSVLGISAFLFRRRPRESFREEEKKEVNQIKKSVEDLFFVCPIHRKKIHAIYGGKSKTEEVLVKENWSILKRLIELLESKVKFLNDKHGLSTKNVESWDGKSIIR